MESWQRWIYDKYFKGLIINKITKKGNAERIFNNDDAISQNVQFGCFNNLRIIVHAMIRVIDVLCIAVIDVLWLNFQESCTEN